MEFKNADDASRALATMNGHPFDAKHIFMINRFTDFERYLNLDETYVEPPPEEYKPKVRSYACTEMRSGANSGVGALTCMARRSSRPRPVCHVPWR